MSLKDLENKILKKNKNKLTEVIDPLMAWIEEMKRSFSDLFETENWLNKININMDKFEKKWIEKNLKN